MDEMLKSLLASGPLGAVLAWFMWVQHQDMRRLEQELQRLQEDRRVEQAINRLVQLDLLRLISSPHVSADVKEAAAGQLSDVKEAQKPEGTKT